MLSLHGRRVDLGDYNFVGYQYSLPFMGGHFEKEEPGIAADVGRLAPLKDRRTVLVTHNPAQGLLDIGVLGWSAGSTSILQVVRERDVLAHIHGHIHACFGRSGRHFNVAAAGSCRGMWIDLGSLEHRVLALVAPERQEGAGGDALRRGPAWIHDVGFGDCARGAAPGLLALLRRSGIRAGRVVDLDCGSDIWAAALVRAGYAVCGVDALRAMIRLARESAPGIQRPPGPRCAARRRSRTWGGTSALSLELVPRHLLAIAGHRSDRGATRQSPPRSATCSGDGS